MVNHYRFADLNVGMSATFSRFVDAAMMEQFEKISGDCNSLHLDDEFAKEQQFPQRVVYGMLVASFYSTLAGVYLPGKYCLLQSVKADFIKPVYIGDEMCIYGEIVGKHESVKSIVVKAHIKNQHGEKVSRAKIEAGVLDKNE